MKLSAQAPKGKVGIAFVLKILLPVLLPCLMQAQVFHPRKNYGAILEPQSKVMNGAGQDLTAWVNYSNVMRPQNKPVLYMEYVGLKDVTSSWSDGLKANLMALQDTFLIPQIGLSMAIDGTPSLHYEQDVAAGLYDTQIERFIDGLKAMAIPAYIRIGYEFNGTLWNGYTPLAYKQAFIRITNMLRARGIEAATVWDFAMDGDMNYMDYYPGDEYVDWWAINLFSASHFTDANASAFMANADQHHKPVLIGETTPRYTGVLNGQQSWDEWFAPFFNFIHTEPGLKAFSYINWQWSKYPQWSTWGDARLEQNTVVGNHFANEMDSGIYLHANTETDFRKTLNFNDDTPPNVPENLSLVETGFPLQLNWDEVADPSGLSHYIIYKHGKLSDYTLDLPYYDKNIAAGDTVTYAVSAMDRAGNESQLTSGLQVTIPQNLSKALNGEFDNQTSNWTLSSYASGASATMEIDGSSEISGPNSCKINISQVTATNWHLQLWQWMPVYKNHLYKITFKAKASSPKVIEVALQQGAPPYTVYLDRAHSLTTEVQSFTDTVTLNATVIAQLKFFLGSPGPVQLWIDAVSLIESSPGTSGINDVFANKSFIHCQPNPFVSSTTIEYEVLTDGWVKIIISDAVNRPIAMLVNERKKKGKYTVDFDAAGLPEGMYLCEMQNGKVNQLCKMLIVK